MKAKIEEANQEAVSRIQKARPELIDVAIAGEAVPGMKRNMILHAGPPVTWEKMCGPMKGAVIGGLILEGLARTRQEAEVLAASGDILFEPCHHHSSVGPMAGVVTWSMPVWVLENKTFGNRAYCTLNEGLGKVLRYGAFSDEVLARLRWMAEDLGPALKKTLGRHGAIDMKSLIAQALQMGDEGHNRNRAGTSLFIREIAPDLVRLDESREKIARILAFIHGNDHFFLNLSMPSCKCTVDAAASIEGSSVVTTMARNGTEFGIRISGLGDQWFTGPAGRVEGLYLPGFSEKDAALDIGDSVITETAGIGGFAMAAAPAIVKFVGGSASDAIRYTRQMYEITVAENDTYQIPTLDFRGTPTGIDLLKVVETGILPAINTGIAHKEPGIGMVGAGLVHPPENCFHDALEAFAQTYGE
ncbi:MAG TPA: DUF1116 domain-containing protein [Desulfatiglandales bacterium]|nr:DUF1116 domain-containing protein [Desulfatiglandales bacterium]